MLKSHPYNSDQVIKICRRTILIENCCWGYVKKWMYPLISTLWMFRRNWRIIRNITSLSSMFEVESSNEDGNCLFTYIK